MHADKVRRTLAIDPGPETSGVVLIEARVSDYFSPIAPAPTVCEAHDKFPNADLLEHLTKATTFTGPLGLDAVVIEKVEFMGMAVGTPVFETVWWSGRFYERVYQRVPVQRQPYARTRLAIVGSRSAKEAAVRAGLLQLFGLASDKEAKGRKDAPGPFYAVSGHAWSALALAVGVYIEIANATKMAHTTQARAEALLDDPIADKAEDVAPASSLLDELEQQVASAPVGWEV